MIRCLAVVKWTLLLALSSTQAWAQTRVACVGEATTHSAHRNYDPEYPELMGQRLDSDFQKDDVQNPMSGGMLYGGGTLFTVGNFGTPKGSAMDHEPTDQAESTLRGPQLVLAEEFEPHLVILGPYGPHEPYTGVSLDQFRPDLQALAERVLAFSSSPGLLIALPLPRNGTDGDTIRRQIYEDTVQVAADLNLVSIDLWTEFLGKADEFEDQNHLNLSGREHMAQVIGDAVVAWQLSNDEPATNGGAGSAGVGGEAGAGSAGLGGSAGGLGVSGSGGAGLGGAGLGGAGLGGAESSAGSPGDLPASGGATSPGGSGSGPVSAPTAPSGMAGGSVDAENGGAANGPVAVGPAPASGSGTAMPSPAVAPVTSMASDPLSAPMSSATAAGTGAPGAVTTDTSDDASGCSLAQRNLRTPQAAQSLWTGFGLSLLGLLFALRRRRR